VSHFVRYFDFVSQTHDPTDLPPYVWEKDRVPWRHLPFVNRYTAAGYRQVLEQEQSGKPKECRCSLLCPVPANYPSLSSVFRASQDADDMVYNELAVCQELTRLCHILNSVLLYRDCLRVVSTQVEKRPNESIP